MPAGLPPEEHIKVAQLDNHEDVAYREHLVQSYGKYKQMVSGYSLQFSNLTLSLLKPYFMHKMKHKVRLIFKMIFT